MPFAAAHSFHPEAVTALAECVGQLLETHGPHPDLLLVLATDEHSSSWPEIGRATRALLGAGCQIGVRTPSLIAGARVALRQPALSLWAAYGLGVAGAVTLCPHPGAEHRDETSRVDRGDGVDRGDPVDRVRRADGGDGGDGGGAWDLAGGDRLDDLVTGSGPGVALLVLAVSGPGVEGLVSELGRRHREVPTAGAVLPAAHHRRSRSVTTGATPPASSAMQFDGRDVVESVVVVVLRSGDLPEGTMETVAGSMEVATSLESWPPGAHALPDGSAMVDPGGMSDAAPGADASTDAPTDAPTDAVTGDLVLDILQRRAQAALVFDSGWAGDLAADLTELDLPLAGLSGVRVIGPVVSLGFTRRSARAARPGAPAMPVVPAIAVALFRDRSDPT